MEVQIILICKTISIVTVSLFFSFSNVFSKEKIGPLENINTTLSGSYLSWVHAKKQGDPNRTGKFLSLLSEKINDKELLINAFSSSLLLNNWNISKKLAEKILLFDKNNFFANIVLSTYFFNEKQYNKSIEYIKNINSTDIDNSFLNIITSWIYLQNNNRDLLYKYFQNENCKPIICLHGGLIYNQLGKKQIAKRKFDKILDQTDSSLRITEILYSFYSNNKFISQIDNLKKKIGTKDEQQKFLSKKMFNEISTPRHGLAEIYFNISAWFYERSLFRYSVYFANIGLTINPDFQALKLLAANSYERLELLEYSLKQIDGVSHESIYFSPSIFLKTSILNEMGDKKKLINFLKNLLDDFQYDEKIEILLADTLRSEGFYEDSLTLYNKIIDQQTSVNNQKYYLFYSRGIALERLKKWKKAERDFMKALKLRPNDPFILNYIGYSWLERKVNIKKALDFITIAAEQEPQDAYIIDSLGWAYYLIGNFKKSIDILELAVTLSPNDATLNDHLGDAYWRDGRTREAVSQWKRILIIDPDFEKIKEVQDKIATGL